MPVPTLLNHHYKVITTIKNLTALYSKELINIMLNEQTFDITCWI